MSRKKAHNMQIATTLFLFLFLYICKKRCSNVQGVIGNQRFSTNSKIQGKLKRNIKIFAKIILGLLTLIVLFFIGTYWYISTEWKKYYTEDEIKSYSDKIDNSPKLSDTLYSIFDKLHNNDRHKSITSIYFSVLWKELILHKQVDYDSWIVRAADFFPKKSEMRGYPEFTLAWGLEKFTSTEKCFDFVMTNRNEQLIRNDSTFKNIAQLQDTSEILEYIVKSQTPSFYKKHPERLNLKTAELRRKLH